MQNHPSIGQIALVLGGGGMFGAYQAGVWEALEEYVEPDLICGASIGALAGWALAAKCPAREWSRQWLEMDPASLPRLRFPRRPLGGCLDTAAFEGLVRRIHGSYQPVIPCAVSITDLLRLEPRAVVSPQVDWVHLAASCAVFGLFPQYRIEGRLYTDGGIVRSVPLWAASGLGATKLIGVNLFPGGGPWWLRAGRRVAQGLTRRTPAAPGEGVEVLMIEHEGPLGSAAEAVTWKRQSVERLIEMGRRDGQAAVPAARRLVKTF
jgi:NTE family protein